MASGVIPNPRKRLQSSDSVYSFPTKTSEISGGNDIYTVLHTGEAIVQYSFSESYSQFQLWLNGVQMFPDYLSTGNTVNTGNHVISFPVVTGDRIRVSFYSTFGMNSIKIKVLY